MTSDTDNIIKKQESVKTIFMTLYFNKKVLNFVVDTPKYIKYRRFGTDFSVELPFDMTEHFRNNKTGKLRAFGLCLTDDPYTKNAFGHASLGYYIFRYKMEYCDIISLAPFTIMKKHNSRTRNLSCHEENFSCRFAPARDSPFVNFIDHDSYNNTLHGEIEMSDYFYQQDHSKRFIKLHSYYGKVSETESKGMTLIINMTHEGMMFNRGVLHRQVFSDKDEMIRHHEKMFNTLNTVPLSELLMMTEINIKSKNQ